MRIHAVVDDELFRAAQQACPHAASKRALLEDALRALVERRAAQDLARMVRDRSFELRPVTRRRPSDDEGR